MSATTPTDVVNGLRRTTFGWGGSVKVRALQCLERVSDLRGNAASGQIDLGRVEDPIAALWVFVSTIGELNAIEPLLRQLATRLRKLKLVLITDHGHYRESYLAAWPDATVCVSLGHSGDAWRLARDYPPQALVVAEIPCLPSDAPCRFSVAFMAEAKRHGAIAVLVNGWLYQQQPSCRMDSIERALLQREYVRAFDAICMQTAEGRMALIAAGADPIRVHTVGNIKFDAMQRPNWNVAQAKSARLLAALLKAERAIIVAGCVTDLGEQQLVLAAFSEIRARHPDALLVLAPRHPENRERMDALSRLLAEHGLRTIFRSALADAELEPEIACLVLDTMGDLRDFYAAASVAHVGVNHNVLEPLGFDKPVTVIPGWNEIYPSYPVYSALRAASALHEATTSAQLAHSWSLSLAGGVAGQDMVRNAQVALHAAAGAVDRHLRVCESIGLMKPVSDFAE